jgi:hypothetical protein
MKPGPPKTAKNPGKDLQRFARLPAKTKELELIKDQAEKTTGQEGVKLDELIREKAGQGIPHLPG